MTYTPGQLTIQNRLRENETIQSRFIRLCGHPPKTMVYHRKTGDLSVGQRNSGREWRFAISEFFP